MTKITKANTWVIIPGYNEAKYLANVLKKTIKITNNLIYVDDGSSDKSAQIAKHYTADVLRHEINLGKGAALKTGCDYAFSKKNAAAVIFMDSDDQHEPADIHKFYHAFKTHQMIFGERSLNHKMPLIRIIGNRLASVLILTLFGEYIPDIPSGYKGLSKKIYQQIKWSSADYAVELEIAAIVAKNKIPYLTVPIETIYHDLDRGMTFLDTIKMLSKIMSWRLTL